MKVKKLILIIVLILGFFLFSQEDKIELKTEYYPNGKTKTQTPYKNGKKHGVEKHYFDDGYLYIEREFINGIKEGIEKQYSGEGVLWRETQFKDGIKHGKEKYYHETGELKSISTCVNGKLHGQEIWFYDTGDIYIIAFNKNGKQEGYQVTFLGSGYRFITFYKNGKPFGIETHYDNNGNLIRKVLHDGLGNLKTILDRNTIFLNKRNQVLRKSVTNNHYVVLLKSEKILSIIDTEAMEPIVTEKIFNHSITDFEVCASYPFINVEVYLHEIDTFADYIYDVKRDKVYGPMKQLKISINEKRWSGDGRLTFVNNHKSITVLKTSKLLDYLNNKDVPDLVRINAYEDGDIWQIKWIGRYLLYGGGNGSSNEECWGVFDLKQKKNYFVSCCGIGNPFKSCDLMDANRITADFFIPLLKEGKLVEISKNFGKEVYRVTGNSNWTPIKNHRN